VLAVYLSGQGVIEASDGELRTIEPGTILLAEDTTEKVTSPESPVPKTCSSSSSPSPHSRQRHHSRHPHRSGTYRAGQWRC
jgi:uncharacterized cupin superfamily protein